MNPDDLSFKIGSVVGAIVMGAVCGLIPLRIAKRNDCDVLGYLGMMACVVAACFGGIIYALPTALIGGLLLFGIRSNGTGLAILAVVGAGGLVAYFSFNKGFDFKQLLARRTSDYRVFTATDGRKIEARVLKVEGGTVRIERRDGQIFESPIGIYSEADQSFIRKASPPPDHLPPGR